MRYLTKPWIGPILWACGLLLPLGLSCSQSTRLPPRTIGISTATPPTSVVSVTPAAPILTPDLERIGYADAIREGNFEAAARAIDAAPLEDQRSPELRYARAVAALELGDVETALEKADGVDEEYPALAEEVMNIRERAARQSRDVALLGALKPTSNSRKLYLAEAHADAGGWNEAQKLAREVLATPVNTKNKARAKVDQELLARAHALLARIGQAQGKPSITARELKWLAVHAPLIDETALDLPEDYDQQIAALDKSFSLSKDDRLARARLFSEEGWVERTERELKRWAGTGAPAPQQAGLIAWALYTSRADYHRAAALFQSAAQAEPQRKAEFLYYRARALTRAHEDTAAIAQFDAVTLLGGGYAEHAKFQAARLRLTIGQFAAAAISFEGYLGRYGSRAQHRDDARYGAAIAHLAARNYDQALKALDALLSNNPNERTIANLTQLKAVAWLGKNEHAQAADLFRRVIHQRPLSLAALLSASRLREMGQPIPPWLQPPPAGPQLTSDTSPSTLSTLAFPAPGIGTSTTSAPLQLSLPEVAWRLGRVGLDTEAELALRTQEPLLRMRFGARANEALCETYGLLESAQRRYQLAQSAANFSVLKYEVSPATAWQWNCIYPRPYPALVAQQSKLQEIPLPLIYAVMRQESGFRPTVVSPAKAVGLMQIIPPTAQIIAQELGVPYEAGRMTLPSTNVRFGAYYLKRLLDMLGGRTELAVAAYNAGPRAVFHWLRAEPTPPLDIFIASLPYAETRNYVYQVLENYARYAYLTPDHEIPRFSLSLPEGLIQPDDAY